MTAAAEMRQQSQQKNSNDAVFVHIPVQSRLQTRCLSLGICVLENIVFRASHDQFQSYI